MPTRLRGFRLREVMDQVNVEAKKSGEKAAFAHILVAVIINPKEGTDMLPNSRALLVRHTPRRRGGSEGILYLEAGS